MGIFGGGFTKPGKGVDKNEPKKRGLFLYFEILVQKFTKFLGANCLYTMTCIIWLFFLWVLGTFTFTNTGITSSIANKILALQPELDSSSAIQSVSLTLSFMFAAGVFSLWGSGPATAAYSYINRCFTRGEHAWVTSDGVDKFKENFKQGMFVVIIDAIVLVLGINALYFYYTLYTNPETSNIMWIILMYVVIMAFVVYTMMHPYIYQLMITFECKIGAIYKNALIIALAKLPVNLILTAIAAAVIYIIFLSLNPLIAALAMLIFGLCFTHYPRDFYAARVIERSILKDMKAKQPSIEYIEEEQE